MRKDSQQVRVSMGSDVNREVSSDSMITGIPARIIKYKWPFAKIIEHEEKLYAKEKHLNKNELAHIGL